MKDIIDFTMGELTTAIDNGVMKAVQRVGINVNKEELIQALELNRKIVRCKDCKYASEDVEWICTNIGGMVWIDADSFCSYGERKEEPQTETKMKTQNSNLTFEKRTMRDCYNCKRYENDCECRECNYEPKDEPQTEREGE